MVKHMARAVKANRALNLCLMVDTNSHLDSSRRIRLVHNLIREVPAGSGSLIDRIGRFALRINLLFFLVCEEGTASKN